MLANPRKAVDDLGARVTILAAEMADKTAGTTDQTAKDRDRAARLANVREEVEDLGARATDLAAEMADQIAEATDQTAEVVDQTERPQSVGLVHFCRDDCHETYEGAVS